MPDINILDSTSFGALDKAGREAVCRLFHPTDYAKRYMLLNYTELFRKRESLSVLLIDYKRRLSTTNPASFAFLNAAQREALAADLLFAFYILSAQFCLDEAEHRRQGLQDLGQQIKDCASYIEQLRALSFQATPESMLRSRLEDSEKPLKYLGLTVLAPALVETMVAISDGDAPVQKPEKQSASLIVSAKTTSPRDAGGRGLAETMNEPEKSEPIPGKTGHIKEWMGKLNNRRLYWVWGGGLLNTIVSILPEDFANKHQTEKVLAAPAYYTGHVSWMLYYARFGIELGLLLKHTIAGPWMSAEERSISKHIVSLERFQTQWQQRKFQLLNDSVWATANMACFFWLVGNGLLGYLGNALTAGLLLMDVALSTWQFSEESTKHNAESLRYERDIRLLRADLLKKKVLLQEQTERDALFAKKGDESKRSEAALAAQEQYDIANAELTALLKAKKQLDLDWDQKKYALAHAWVYALGLLVAFSMLCCFFFPPAALLPATVMLLGVIGAVFCFVLTIGNAAVLGAMDIVYKKRSIAEKDREYALKLTQFVRCDNEFVKKQLYLDMKLLSAETAHEEASIRYQKLKLVRGILVDALVPALIFFGFTFLPFGVGIAALAVGFALILASHYILKRFEPPRVNLPTFEETDYQLFKQKAQLPAPKAQEKSQPAFFAKKKPEDQPSFDAKTQQPGCSPA